MMKLFLDLVTKDNAACFFLGAIVWHLIFSTILALARWKPGNEDRYSATSKRESWPAHDRIPIGHYKPPPPPPKLAPTISREQPRPPSQPPTEKPTRGR